MPGNELFTRPDVFPLESEAGALPVALTGSAAAGFVDVASWGPIGKAVLVTSPADGARKFGNDKNLGNLVLALENFFAMGGQRAYVVRVAHWDGAKYTATKASVRIDDGASPSKDLFKVDALYTGTRGNAIAVVVSNVVQATGNAPGRFDFTVLVDGMAVEHYTGVTLNDDDPDFIETKVNADPNRLWTGSRYITVTSLLAGYNGEVPPEGTYALTGGTNGDTGIVSGDYVGNAARRDGVYAYDLVDEIVNICHPGNTSVEVILGGLNYVYNWPYSRPFRTNMYVYDLPLGATPQEALQFVRDDIANTTGYEAVYYPWIKRGNRYDPAAPYMLGVWAQNDALYGVWESPAGTRFPIIPATGLAYECALGDESILFPKGVNFIVKRDYYGYVPMVSRTLRTHSQFRYLAVRRFVNYIKKHLYMAGQQFLQRMNAPVVWRQIAETADGLLRQFWSLGAFGGKPRKASYYVKCDETTNPPELVAQGICTCEIGIVPAKPIEHLVFNVVVWAEGSLPLGSAVQNLVE